MQMRNSLSLGQEATQALIASGTPYVIRMKIPANQSVVLNDIIRGEVTFSTNELDDKVLMKGDGMPTWAIVLIVVGGVLVLLLVLCCVLGALGSAE